MIDETELEKYLAEAQRDQWLLNSDRRQLKIDGLYEPKNDSDTDLRTDSQRNLRWELYAKYRIAE